MLPVHGVLCPREAGFRWPDSIIRFACSSVTCVITARGRRWPAPARSHESRRARALISYCLYLGKLFWPTDLAVFYPHPGHWPLAKVLLAGGLILGISGLLFV